MSAYTEQQREDAIEQMMGERRYIPDFWFHGPDIEKLLCLFMSRALPLRDDSRRDDKLIDAYEAERDQLRAAFVEFANIPLTTGKGDRRSRVDRYLDFHEANRMEDAA